MKDQDKIIAALIELRKLRHKKKKTDYCDGLANLAETMIGLISARANSFEYKDSLNTLIEQARNAKAME